MKRSSFKSYIIIIFIFSFTILFAGCGNKEEGNTAAVNATTQVNQNSPAQMQMPDLYGEVKAVSGYSITLALLEIQQRPQLNDDQRLKMQQNGNNFNRRNENNQNNKQGQNNNNNNRNRGNSGNGFPRGGNQARKYTGKSETVTITDNTKITTFSRNNGNFSETELKASDIKVGTILQIWYKKDSQAKEIERIRLIQSFNRSPNNNNNSGNNNNNGNDN